MCPQTAFCHGYNAVARNLKRSNLVSSLRRRDFEFNTMLLAWGEVTSSPRTWEFLPCLSNPILLSPQSSTQSMEPDGEGVDIYYLLTT